MSIRLYLDEDAMDNDLVRALRARGVDVMPASDAGMVARKDDDHLARAAAEGRVVYSFNMCDFCRLHGEFLKRRRHHAGIVVARQQTYSVGEQMRRLLRLVATVSADEMMDRLEFLSDWA